MEEQLGDENPGKFSYFNDTTPLETQKVVSLPIPMKTRTIYLKVVFQEARFLMEL